MKISKLVLRQMKRLGINEKEVMLYAAALRLGACTVQQLAEESKVNRSTIYLYLEKLKEKGILTESIIGKKRLFVPEPPEVLNRLLQQEKTIQEEQQTQLEQIEEKMPQLLSLFQEFGAMSGSLKRPEVKVFNGIDGVLQSYRHILQHAEKEVLSYFSTKKNENEELEQRIQKEYSVARAKKKIRVRNLMHDQHVHPWYKENQDTLYMETREMKELVALGYNVEINLYNGKYVHCMSFDESAAFAFIIENEPLARLLQNLFENVWNR